MKLVEAPSTVSDIARYTAVTSAELIAILCAVNFVYPAPEKPLWWKRLDEETEDSDHDPEFEVGCRIKLADWTQFESNLAFRTMNCTKNS